MPRYFADLVARLVQHNTDRIC